MCRCGSIYESSSDVFSFRETTMYYYVQTVPYVQGTSNNDCGFVTSAHAVLAIPFSIFWSL